MKQTASNLFNLMTALYRKDKIPITDKQLKVLVRNLEMIRGFNLVKLRFTQPAKYDKKNAEHEEKLHVVSYYLCNKMAVVILWNFVSCGPR